MRDLIVQREDSVLSFLHKFLGPLREILEGRTYLKGYKNRLPIAVSEGPVLFWKHVKSEGCPVVGLRPKEEVFVVG